MAVGDDATAAGFSLVPETGTEMAKVRYGAEQINRTRDYVAQVLNQIATVWGISRGGTGGTTAAEARTNLGFYSGTASPVNTDGKPDGTVYFKIIP